MLDDSPVRCPAVFFSPERPRVKPLCTVLDGME